VDQQRTQHQREKNLVLGQRVALAGICTSALLALGNISVGLMARSTAVLAAGLEFAGDVLASALVLVGMHLASRPADSDHPYGHGRFETLAGLAVGVILSVGGVGICWRSLQQIGEVHQPPGSYAIWPLAAAIVLRGVMAMVKFRVGRRLGSHSLVADAWNDTVDILSAVAALVALGLTLYRPETFLAADHYGGFAVGVVVVFTGIRVIRDTSLDLADTMPSPERLEGIRRVALATPGVLGVEKCFARRTGMQYHVDLHLEVDPNLTVWQSHEIASIARNALRDELDWVADVLVHIEPAPGVVQRQIHQLVAEARDGQAEQKK
jgi:cation diffusion facilitator family transporter